MVGIVVVSHSSDLAGAAVRLALQMVQGPAPPIEVAAGTSDHRLGTDAARVAEAITAADDGDGVVVIMDLGSAVGTLTLEQCRRMARAACDSDSPASAASRFVKSRTSTGSARMQMRPEVVEGQAGNR